MVCYTYKERMLDISYRASVDLSLNRIDTDIDIDMKTNFWKPMIPKTNPTK